MLRAMFGMGGTEILVILIVALLFLGPDKLPDAAKKISKGIRDIKKQSRALQRTIEDDEHIGGAIRDLRSALRGEDEPYRPPPRPKQIEASSPDPVPSIGAAAGALAAAAQTEPETATPAETHDAGEAGASGVPDTSSEGASAGHTATHAEAPVSNGEHPAAAEAPAVTLPPTAGEPDGSTAGARDADLAALVKPAPNTIARGATPAGPSEPPEPKHG
jgi:sec-independent protein translocase protein TatB